MLLYLLMKGKHKKLRYRSVHCFIEDGLTMKLKLHILGYRTSYTGPCSPAQEVVGAKNVEMDRTLSSEHSVHSRYMYFSSAGGWKRAQTDWTSCLPDWSPRVGLGLHFPSPGRWCHLGLKCTPAAVPHYPRTPHHLDLRKKPHQE